jgi:hypothetical protein
MRTFDRLVWVSCAVAAMCAPRVASAQGADSARKIPPLVAQIPRDSLVPPIAPRRAFFYSFMLPGYSQTILGRHKAAAGFLFVEAMSLVMIRESAADTHEARRAADDTIIVSYVDANGNPAKITQVPHFGATEIHSRNAHVEDWVALLIGNHLLAGADAFVAAHLWDVPARLGFRRTGNGTALSLSVRW